MKIFKKYYCVKQHDIKDCGVACLATIAKQYGLKVSISKLREISGTDNSGTSMYGIVNAAKKINLKCKVLKTKDYDDIYGDFPKPAIVHLKLPDGLQHYVVLHEATKKEIIIADPYKGIVKYSQEEFYKVWTGVIALMAPSDSFQTGDQNVGIYKKFFSIVKQQKMLFITIIISSILVTLFGIFGTFYFQMLVDDIVPNGLQNTLVTVSAAMIVLGIFKVLTNYFRSTLAIYLSQNIDVALLLGYYNHVIELPINFFATRKTGEIMSRFSDAEKIRNAISNTIITLIIDLGMTVFGGIILYSQNKMLFFMSFIPIIIYFLLVILFKKPIENANRNTMENAAYLNSYLYESLQGMETVKAYNGENKISLEGEKRTVKFFESIKHFINIANIQVMLKSFVQEIFPIVVLWLGTVLMIKGEITLGVLLNFNVLLSYFLGPIERLLNLQGEIQSGIVAAERLKEILDLEKEKLKDEDLKVKLTRLRGDIELCDVFFSYNLKKVVLNRINLKINSGQKIAFVGESGSGKTTLAKLLLNFYDVDSGKILIDSFDIKDINKTVLRDKIAYINQETFIFAGTIKENLLFANQDASYEEIIEACKLAKIHDFISELPDRYESYIEERGANLSSGQKQRISIARSILKKPQVIILDEATSNLDATTEKEIERTIRNITKDITTITVAHRLNTIVNCDKIFVLEKGEIIEEGTHVELINRRGKYYSLWNDQMSEFNYSYSLDGGNYEIYN